MSRFWQVDRFQNQTAIVLPDGQEYSYQHVQQLINLIAKVLPEEKRLGIIFCQNQLADLIVYLAALQQGQAVCLLAGDMEQSLRNHVIEAYQPNWLWQERSQPVPSGYTGSYQWNNYVMVVANQTTFYPIHPELAVLLSTSGTTGSPKMVRLSYQNLQENAASISEYLNITAEERPVTTLPMQYSYGLSVINSHFLTGATILLNSHSIVSRDFWDFVKRQQPSSWAGVPYSYQMLWKLRLPRMSIPSLRTMTQAGGRLDIALQESYAAFAQATGRRFFVMYGQTEATARMSYVPPERLSDKLGSIGIAIPRGSFELAEDGELIYSGSNVMLGYAYTFDDLAKDDELQGRLLTGDLAQQDEDGFWFITGRKKRFLKIFGLRINLDEVERMLEQVCNHPVFCIGKDDYLVIVVTSRGNPEKIKQVMNAVYHLHHSSYTILPVEQVPYLISGKVDYGRLQEMLL